MKSDVRHETREARCAWCWNAISGTESHTAVEAVSPPYFGQPLRFHHACWQAYSAVAGPADARSGASTEWAPERIEKLRIHTGMLVKDFCRLLHCATERFYRIMSSSEPVPAWMPAALRKVANDFRFDRISGIEWTAEAVHSLQMKAGLDNSEFAAQIGAKKNSLNRWLYGGVPKQSLRIQNRMGQFAMKLHFTAVDVIEDRLWDSRHVRQFLEAASLSPRGLADRIGMSATSIRAWSAGEVPVSRAGCWLLTREARRESQPLPPLGVRRKQSRS